MCPRFIYCSKCTPPVRSPSKNLSCDQATVWYILQKHELVQQNAKAWNTMTTEVDYKDCGSSCSLIMTHTMV